MPARTLLIISDIFGHTPEVQSLAGQLTHGLDARVRILSPYAGERPRFPSEVEAHAAFIARTGLDWYAKVVGETLAEYRPALAVGFSVGATALWIALAGLVSAPPAHSVLYYGSRIREHAHLRPAGDLQLVFAEAEASFDPAELVTALRGQGVAAELLPGTAHGFLNRLSPRFDAQAYAAEMARLRGLLA
ncbi:MAG: hydrolase [Proteobacteria bacterium]|nr:hydrolase [Pseudomonadota bacterium]MBU1594820.1 hydrolase [Pseudomonadota bacterium]